MQYEVEIKSLLGEEENALALKNKMGNFGATLTSKNKQLNHYFVGNELRALEEKLTPHFSPAAAKKFKDILQKVSDFSVRTREKDGNVLLVVKASVGGGTSANGVSRMEFEEPVGLSLGALDELLRSAGFEYQAKWSREREEYECRGVTVCLDRNAGYGWIAEFEKMVDSEDALEDARAQVRALMEELGAQELPQDRLERMFEFYNAHWPDYYGTDKVFTVA